MQLQIKDLIVVDQLQLIPKIAMIKILQNLYQKLIQKQKKKEE